MYKTQCKWKHKIKKLVQMGEEKLLKNLNTDSDRFFLHRTHSRSHILTVCRTPLDEGSARRTDLYLTVTHTKDRHICPRRNSKPQVPESERPQTRPLGSAHSVCSEHYIQCLCEKKS